MSFLFRVTIPSLGLMLAVATAASAQSLPQGLTCGLSYIDSSTSVSLSIGDGVIISINNDLSVAEGNACNGIQTANVTTQSSTFPFPPDSGCNSCFNGCNTTINACNPVTVTGSSSNAFAGPGFVGIVDGDIGNHDGAGYVHQEYTMGTSDPSVSDMFALPVGTVCGFHHTENSPGRMCMNFQPSKAFGIPENMTNPPGNVGCPTGWNPRRAFDMSSSAWYYVWCEYQDPRHLGTAGTAMGVSGIACGVSSNFGTDDPTGANQGLNGGCLGYDTLHGNGVGSISTFCPSMTNSAYINGGESNNTGLGFCSIGGATIPPLSPTPVPRVPPPPPLNSSPPPAGGGGGGVGTPCKACKIN
jgi:hypothetical protein